MLSTKATGSSKDWMSNGSRGKSDVHMTCDSKVCQACFKIKTHWLRLWKTNCKCKKDSAGHTGASRVLCWQSRTLTRSWQNSHVVQKLQLINYHHQTRAHPQNQTVTFSPFFFLKTREEQNQSQSCQTEALLPVICWGQQGSSTGTHLTTRIETFFQWLLNSGPVISLLRRNFSLPFPNSKPQNISSRKRRIQKLL